MSWQALHFVIALGTGVVGMLVFLAVAELARLAASRVGTGTAVSGDQGTAPPAPSARPLGLLDGSDGRMSTSKVQWFAWTLVVVGGYCALVAARALQHDFTADVGVPGALLTAMGFSTVTLTTAKGITSVYTANSWLVKTQTQAAGGAAPAPPTRGLLTSDRGDLDLSKVQLLTWTVIAIGIWLGFLLSTLWSISFAGPGQYDPSGATLPDIGATLLVLTGLSHGGYLGTKLVTVDSVRVDSLVPATVQAGAAAAAVRVLGAGFGDNRDGRSAVELDGVVVPVTRWSDGEVRFEVPANQPAGTPPVTVIVSGMAFDARELQIR